LWKERALEDDLITIYLVPVAIQFNRILNRPTRSMQELPLGMSDDAKSGVLLICDRI